MDSSVFFFTTVIAAAIGLLMFTLFRNLRFHREDNTENNDFASSSSPSSPPESSLSPSSPSSSLNRIWTHHVFPSFRGEDVRRDFLSHIQAEFERKGITPFIDNEIKRGESIGPELIRAIRGSKIAIILLSRNYASSSWCLDELSEIMKCREELGQTVMVVFYKVDPSDVKKLNGDFGEVFRKTCARKSKEDIGRWRKALAEVATIAGYHSSNWDNEASTIKKLATDISNKLNNFSPSRDFDGFVGMRAHLEKMEQLLCLDSDEVRMIGIWGPSGIGKTTIARVVYNVLFNSFQMSVFMESIEGKYTRPCSDDYSAKLQLQQQFMSRITNDKDVEISHLGVIQDRQKDKKVLVVLDGVDQSMQLDAMAKETRWFGSGSRIIITTQNQKLFTEHGINQIYKVDFPPYQEALQILCMYAFGQKSPKDGFEKLAWEVTRLAGNLPLGLRVMGSYLRGMSKQEWTKAITRLRASLDTKIQSILKLSYDALDDQDKDLFLHIACFFNMREIEKVEAYLADSFLDVSHGLDVLTEKSLISIDECTGYIEMHNLLAQLGQDIVRKQHLREPGQRLFLTDSRDFFKALKDNGAGNKSVIGIHVDLESMEEKLHINERAFEGMYNLQFLRFRQSYEEMYNLPRGLDYIPRNLRLLDWLHFPMTCLPSTFKTDFLVTLKMPFSKLEKLWEGTKPLRNLKWIDLNNSQKLAELPDLSTATNLQELDLSFCSGLIKLTSTIGNATNLQMLNLIDCSSLINLPSSIGNAINLRKLNLRNCSSLVELPFSIGNLHKLLSLDLQGCSKLEVLPTNINLESLHILDLTNCLLLERFPEISTNIIVLKLQGTAIKEVPSSIKSCPRLTELRMSYSENLKDFPHVFDSITHLYLSYTELQEVHPWVKRISRLNLLELSGCKKLVSFPQISGSISSINATNCESLERIDCSFQNSNISLRFDKCFKLNQETKDLIIQAPSSLAVLPGRKVPAYFTHRASGDSLRIKLNEMILPTSITFKACVLLVYRGDDEAHDYSSEGGFFVTCKNTKKYIFPLLSEHLYIFNVDADVTSSEVVFNFKLRVKSEMKGERSSWKIGECGVVQLSQVPL